MRTVKIISLLLLSAVLMMFVVNKQGQVPTNQYNVEECTRYCHNVACPHFKRNFDTYQNQLPIAKSFRETYWGNIRALKQNAIGLSYQQINLLIYIIGFPMLTSLLTWGAFRKGKA